MLRRLLGFTIGWIPMPVQRGFLRMLFLLMGLRYPALRHGLLPIEGKRFLIEILNPHRRYCLWVRKGRLRPVPSSPGEADVFLKGDLGVFLDVLARRVDPDVALFRRKICLVGEMGPAVYLKHLFMGLSR